jgi:hypothetical protein
MQKFQQNRFNGLRRLIFPPSVGAFSHSDVKRVATYIAQQEAHHKKKTFSEEYELFVRKYGLEWRED